jgi:hypothetical protein
MEHAPAASAALQDSPVLAETVTLPVGVTLGDDAVTVKLNATTCPTSEGFIPLARVVLVVPCATVY